MSTESKRRVVYYKRAVFLTPQTKTLQLLVEEGLKTLPKPAQRIQKITREEDEVRRVLNEHRKVGNARGGVLYRYSPGQQQVVMAPDANATEWSVGQVESPNLSEKQKSEFVDGLLFFLIFGNDVIVSQSASLRANQLAEYLNDLLQKKTNLVGENEFITLADHTSGKFKDVGLAKVRSVRFGVPLSDVVTIPPAPDSRKSKPKTKHVLNAKRMGAIEAALAAFGLDLPSAGLTHDDAESVEATLELRVTGHMPEDPNDFLDAVGNVFAEHPDQDFEVELANGTTLRGSELTLKSTVTVESQGGIPKPHSVWTEMHKFLLGLHKDGSLIS
ncbi:MAG: hypothetical protein WC661_08725 [Opitutaceae bacterium]|jgi:hypothetical protein